jgi:hypothetical protein
MALFSNNNAMLIDKCSNLHNLTVTLAVTADLITFGDAGFSLQLNAYPPKGQLSQGQTLTWLQYILYVQNGSLLYEIQYWASNPVPWPKGYVPNPPNTLPFLPVLPNDDTLTPFGTATSSRIAHGSQMKIALATDAGGNVTSALFAVTDPSGKTTSTTFQFPAGAQYPICAFQVNLVGPGSLSDATFVSGAGTLGYSVSSGSLADQGGGPGSACAEWSGFTGELSNVIYGPLTPASGPSINQSLSVVSQGPLTKSLDEGVIYAITQDDRLLWYRHTGIADGREAWAGHLPVPAGLLDGEIGGGWDFRNVFCGGKGIIYAVTSDYRLLWYDHSAFADGQIAFNPPPALTDADKNAGKVSGQVGGGWNFKHVFSGGNGVIYAVTQDNRLLWYRHTGAATGQSTWAPHLPVAAGRLDGQIGEGWDFKHVFSGGNGVIYAVTNDNRLLWYRHTGFADGRDAWAPHLPVPAGHIAGQIGEGWNFKQVFSGGDGVIYAVTQDNRLLWYRHTGFADGRDAWASHLPVPAGHLDGQIGGGWDFKHVYSRPT